MSGAFSNLLEDWIERQGSSGTLGELGVILRKCEFIAASFELLIYVNNIVGVAKFQSLESFKTLGPENAILKNVIFRLIQIYELHY